MIMEILNDSKTLLNPGADRVWRVMFENEIKDGKDH